MLTLIASRVLYGTFSIRVLIFFDLWLEYQKKALISANRKINNNLNSFVVFLKITAQREHIAQILR